LRKKNAPRQQKSTAQEAAATRCPAACCPVDPLPRCPAAPLPRCPHLKDACNVVLEGGGLGVKRFAALLRLLDVLLQLRLILREGGPELEALEADLLGVLADALEGEVEQDLHVALEVLVVLLGDHDDALEGLDADPGLGAAGGLADHLHDHVALRVPGHVRPAEQETVAQGGGGCQPDLVCPLSPHTVNNGSEDLVGLLLVEDVLIELLAEVAEALECGPLDVVVRGVGDVVEEVGEELVPGLKWEVNDTDLGDNLCCGVAGFLTGRGENLQALCKYKVMNQGIR
jgi:hypothetical protein